MSNTVLGLLVGLVLGLAGAFGGIAAFLLVFVLGLLGFLVGRLLDGELDLDGLTGRGRSTNSPDVTRMTTISAEGQPPPDDAVTQRLVTTTANTPRRDVGRHAAADTTAERGALTIDDVVVEKVAVAAAGEVRDVGGAHRRVLGVAASREDGGGRPRVSARVAGQVVALEVRLSVRYPASVRAVTEAVRAHVRDRVHALTELTVTRVDIAVASLAATTTSSGRRVS